MYTRYVPKSDGTYVRQTMLDPPRKPQPPAPAPAPEKPEPAPCPPALPPRRPAPPPRPRPQPVREKDGSIGSFLRQLLPRDFDIGDLLVIVLLLLMSGDCQEDQNTALLTLALYFFL